MALAWFPVGLTFLNDNTIWRWYFTLQALFKMFRQAQSYLQIGQEIICHQTWNLCKLLKIG
jgi:hypothetical protein